jgi:SAM-dependent methyltransferase
LREKTFNSDTERLLERVRGAGPRTLDAGCGRAEIALWLADRGCQVLGVDRRLPFPDGRVVRVDGVAPGQLHLTRADLLTIELDTEFDAVLALGVLHGLGRADRVARLLERLCRWTRPGGLLALSWLLDARPVTPRHRGAHFPSRSEVGEILASVGFRPTDVWTAEAEHAHEGPRHRHTVSYGVWRNLSEGFDAPG